MTDTTNTEMSNTVIKDSSSNDIYLSKNIFGILYEIPEQKERIRIRNAKYREEHRDEINRRRRNYKRYDPVKRQEYYKKYYSENKEHVQEHVRKYRDENKGHCRELGRKYNLKRFGIRQKRIKIDKDKLRKVISKRGCDSCGFDDPDCLRIYNNDFMIPVRISAEQLKKNPKHFTVLCHNCIKRKYCPTLYIPYGVTCFICGESDPAVLVSHHYNGYKNGNMSKLDSYSFLYELTRVCFVCENCHTSIHIRKIEITEDDLYGW